MENAINKRDYINVSSRLKEIIIKDKFWSDRIDLVSKEVIPYQWDALNDNIPGAEPSHAIENFRIAAGLSNEQFYGMVFQDSDVAKWIEAASYSLATHPNADLEKIIDDVIDLIGKAQQPDGYLNTYYTVAKPEERWTDFSYGHELYCAGHMLEAAVAYFEVTGKRKLLDIMCKYVDYIDSVIGPEEGKMHKYSGHEVIELALYKLYKITGDEKHLKLIEYLIYERGKQPCFLKDERGFGKEFKDRWHDTDYHQAHSTVIEQSTAEGHSVRAMYLYASMADLVLETGNRKLYNALLRLWDNVTNYRMYITGGLGSQGHGERFTIDYDLPNDTVYAETCASIGLVFWAYRMLLIDPDNRYADVMEKVIYNGALSGISFDGKKYFYVNPLEVLPEIAEKRYDHLHIKSERQAWYGCSCCPPNIARLITSLGHYIYSQKNSTIYTHLYIDNIAKFIINGVDVSLEQESNYPWEGHIKFNVNPGKDSEFSIAFRKPGWSEYYSASINGKKIDDFNIINGYIIIKRKWQKGDLVELSFPMNVELIRSNPNVRENIGKVAIQRGPIIYCLEEIDNGKNLFNIYLTNGSKLEAEFMPDLFNGIMTIKGNAVRLDDSEWKNVLYKPDEIKTKNTIIKAVPYSMWGNRKPCEEMLVWISYK